jgi:hypothetical protein
VTDQQRKSLKLLAKHGTACVTDGTRVTDGELSIHFATAMALIRHGFAMHSQSTLAITPKGMRRSGLTTETEGERRRRQAAEALAAQQRGEWQPAPAGAAAAADRAAAQERRHVAHLIEDINSNKEQARFEREMMELARSWAVPALIEECRRNADRYEAIAAKAVAELDEVRGKKQAKAA